MKRFRIGRLTFNWYSSWFWGRAWVGKGYQAVDLGKLRIIWHKTLGD